MSYVIKKIPENYINNYKYNYLDHLEAIVDLRDNYWDVDMQLYCINNSNLPLNTFTIDMQLPYQEANNISFNLASDQEGVKDKVDGNFDYAKLYESKFEIDVSQNEYLKQNLSNAKLTCIVNLEVDPQVIEKSGFTPDQEMLDGLITETSEQRVMFDLDYSNYYKVEKDAVIQNNYGYSLARGESSCFSKIRLVDVTSNDYQDNTKSIVNLTTISSATLFQVLSAKVKFYYWLDYETVQNELEINLNIDTNLTNSIDINLQDKTIYDFVNNKVVVDPNGITGFYIPRFSSGYYELELKIYQDGNLNTFMIKNIFNFKQNINKPYIAIGNITINDLDGYKEVIW